MEVNILKLGTEKSHLVIYNILIAMYESFISFALKLKNQVQMLILFMPEL